VDVNKKKRSFNGKFILIMLIPVYLFALGFGKETNANALNLTLTVTPVNSENYVQLKWNLNDNSQPYTYRVYQKKEGSNQYQSISTADLKRQIKVLNVYPTANINQWISYTTWNGTNRTILKSASAEMWMEQPNSENAKGYGMGLIDVEPVSLEAFNSNPSAYLKNNDGSWKYDVIYFGAWDQNGSTDNRGDISSTARDIVANFMNSGRGILFGHDVVIGSVTGHPNFESLRNIIKVKLLIQDNLGYVPTLSSNKVQIVKEGLLTDYPWNIGSMGTVLNIPLTHSTSQLAYGEIWMKFYDYQNSPEGNWRGPEVSDSSGNGTNNFYLTTINNAAMIQTGHSNGEATPDEQKILANTLFYLSQLTRDTQAIDRSATDVKAPSKPTINTTKFDNTTKTTTIQFNTNNDNGSSYTYKVEAKGENSGQIISSNEVTITLTSGIKGFSYVIDNSPSTIPNGMVNSNGTINIPVNTNQNAYLHIQAIDQAGNVSETAHYQIKNIVDEKFELNIPTPNNFSPITLKEQATEYKTSFNSTINIKNLYPVTGRGWRLDVSATRLTLSDGSNYQLPKSSLFIEPLSNIRAVGSTYGSLPTKGITTKTAIDNGKITLARATPGNGIGEYTLSFPNQALSVIIDPTTAKTGNYQTVITWELVSAP